MASIKDNFDGDIADSTFILNAANDWAGQSFTASSDYDASRIDIYISKGVGDNVGNITVALYATDVDGHPTGSALASGTIANSEIGETPSYAWETATLSSTYSVSNGTKYCIVVHGTSLDASNILYWPFHDDGIGASSYANGDTEWSINGGSSWSTDTTADALFRVYGDPTAIDDKLYTRKLVAFGNNEVWYESSAGTLTELTAANGDISTINPLTAVEAFQKVFIANKTNLKVIDFGNTKITTTDVGSHPPDFGNELTGDTSGAKMIVDYITALSGACTIYGRRTTTATFQAETISGTDDDDNDIDFTTSAVETAPPHWYDWTVYGNDSSFGTMPSSAYLVALYRGRLVLSGDEDYPHQWYMSKVANPYNFVYTSTNELSAVAGNNTQAGEIGDIVRSLISYGDDFLVFGCDGSMHLLDGDPQSGGSIDKLSDTTGIYGWTAWCKDDVDNLYFLGRNGIYVMSGGRSKPQNISKSHIPQLITDWALDSATYRIVMGFDSKRRGILFVRTTLSDGTCSGYFYSLETNGFYPITLLNNGGIYCSYDYNSDTPADRELLFGCYDGYVRGFVDAQKNDDNGASDSAILSYFGIVENLAEDADNEGKLLSLTVEMAGGASSGDFSDSDGCSYEYHKADDAETVLENLRDGATASESGTLSGTGRKNRIRKKIRAAWLALKFYNSTASETFGINRIFGMVKEVGRIK